MADPRKCASCGQPIAEARLRAVPNTPWCVGCAERKVAKVGGVMEWDGKHTSVLHILPTQRQARREWKSGDRHGATVNLRLQSDKSAYAEKEGFDPFDPEDR